jgi:protease-4
LAADGKSVHRVSAATRVHPNAGAESSAAKVFMPPTPLNIARQAGANLTRAARQLADASTLARRKGFWLRLRVGRLDEFPLAGPPFRGGGSLGLFETLETLDSAARDAEVEGVLLHFTDALPGFSKAASLRRAVLALREAKVPVAAYAEVLDAGGLLVASAADRLWMPEAGHLHLVGLRLESLFLRGALDRMGLSPEVVNVGRYKSAGERFTRERMSAESREQLEALADDLYAELVDGVAAGRGLEADDVRALIDDGPYHAKAAVAAGLVDGCCYPDELPEALRELSDGRPGTAPDSDAIEPVDAPLYHSLRCGDPGWRPLFGDLPRIAYVVARGAIARGRSPRGIASEAYGALLDELRRDEGVRGVLLRIESGGGDAIASDLLCRSVSMVSREKPVVVSMGEVVASGGYYMASAAHELIAEVGSVTGSIGVVGGKLNLEGLYERVGVKKDSVERGARAGLLSESRGFTADEKSAVRGGMAALYDTFVDRVASGRGLSIADTRKVAEGRVWSGRRAREVGLVDAIGGPLEALHSVCRRAGLERGDPFLLERHPRLLRLRGLADVARWLPWS